MRKSIATASLSGLLEEKLVAAGYDGPHSVQAGANGSGRADAGREADEAYRSLAALQLSLRQPIAATGRRSAYAGKPPLGTPARVTGFDFVELTVDPRAEVSAQSIRRGMGFAAVQMRSARLPTLSIPGNYYDDLPARTDLDRRSTPCVSSPSATTKTAVAARTFTSAPPRSGAASSSKSGNA
jgi:hypothetical protein